MSVELNSMVCDLPEQRQGVKLSAGDAVGCTETNTRPHGMCAGLRLPHGFRATASVRTLTQLMSPTAPYMIQIEGLGQTFKFAGCVRGNRVPEVGVSCHDNDWEVTLLVRPCGGVRAASGPSR
jgi:hypothetical protein